MSVARGEGGTACVCVGTEEVGSISTGGSWDFNKDAVDKEMIGA